MLKKVVALMVFSVCSVQASANQFSPFGEVTESYTSSAWTMVKLSGAMVNAEGCPKTGYYAINSGSSNYDAILSSILAAQMAKKTVRFWLAGCAGQQGEYPKIVSIQVR